jgi:hypothetical protein
MRFWTHYWTDYAVSIMERELRAAKVPLHLDHTASNRFARVSAGDVVYVISYLAGSLRVIGSIEVAQIVGMAAARAALRYEPWEADMHVLASAGSAARFDAFLSNSQVDQLEFVHKDGTKCGVARKRDGTADHQTFRGVREITRATAAIFDQVLGADAVRVRLP